MTPAATIAAGHDIQARALNPAGGGPWSATASHRTRDHGDTSSAATPLARS